MSCLAVSPNSVFSVKVPEQDRAKVLALHFPKAHFRFENFTHHIAERICAKYVFDQWDFFELGNGGFYMAPSSGENFLIDLPFGRNYSGVVSKDAFGIICSMYTFCFLADEDPRLALHHMWLSSFYQSHPEWEKIWWAVE